MGCDIYTVEAQDGAGWTEVGITFNEGRDDIGCLCTFASMQDYPFDAGGVRELALLGAAVALVHDGHFEKAVGKAYYVIPDDLPDWVIESVNRILPATEPKS